MTQKEEYYCLTCDNYCALSALELGKTVILWICPNCQYLYDEGLLETIGNIAHSLLETVDPEITKLDEILMIKRENEKEEKRDEFDKN